jgi:hypothetical protein
MEFDFKTELARITPLIAKGAKVYIFCAYWHWEHFCKIYKYAFNVNISEHIDGFIDNNINKRGSLFHGKYVYALSDIDLNNAVVIIIHHDSGITDKIAWQLVKAGLLWRHSFFTPETLTILLHQYEYQRLLKFKDKHKNKRCFIIGNGPSLRVDDLDKIKDEISLAANSIYLIFNKTSWRPSYYAISDKCILNTLHEDIRKEICCPIFYNFNDAVSIDDFSLINEYYFLTDYGIEYNFNESAKPNFSIDPLIKGGGSDTVTYINLQLAVYMGFNEIYLLGIDNSIPISRKMNGEIIVKDVSFHFYNRENKNYYIGSIDRANAAYQSAKEYADLHGIKIFNATCGGELEIFERVELNSLFNS